MILADVYSDALRECSDAASLIITSNVFHDNQVTFNGIAYSDQVHFCTINGAFLDLFKAFERFLECSFVCYMHGQTGLNGKSVLKYVSPTTDDHALGILKGTSQHSDFTNRDVIVKLSKLYFENGGPYIALNSISMTFEEMKKIRNAITHVSYESQKTFISLARSKLGSLPPNMNTAVFLNTAMSGTTSTYFMYYKGVIENTMDKIANPVI